MATFDYSALKTRAEALITKFGQTATLRQLATGAGAGYQPIRGTPTDTPIEVIDLRKMERDAAGVLTKEVRRQLLVSTKASVTPQKDDTVQIGSTWHKILAVRPVNPGGTNLLFKLELET